MHIQLQRRLRIIFLVLHSLGEKNDDEKWGKSRLNNMIIFINYGKLALIIFHKIIE